MRSLDIGPVLSSSPWPLRSYTGLRKWRSALVVQVVCKLSLTLIRTITGCANDLPHEPSIRTRTLSLLTPMMIGTYATNMNFACTSKKCLKNARGEVDITNDSIVRELLDLRGWDINDLWAGTRRRTLGRHHNQ